ncbi:hypothetical protein KF728_17150 [Candidatus Obscuribacterales bacterium]|nr:hypothetical protein [Candidatus Obscuribacterales bacterium]
MANTRKKKNPNQAGINLLFALGSSLALALILGPLLFSDKSTVGTPIMSTNGSMISDTIGRLSSADSSSQRISAARWLSTQASANPESVIRSLGDSLTNDPDPVVRAQAASSLGTLARTAREKPTSNASQEKLIAEVLQRQYSKEASDSVRRCIIGAAAELDIDDANGLVEKGISDNDPSVKEEALRARVEREQRAQLKKLG